MNSLAPLLEASTHIYSLGGKPLVSVSRVIDAVLKKSWDGVDPATVENAAERGRRVEQYATTLFRDGYVEMPVGERTDVEERMEVVYRWWERHRPRLLAAQEVVWSEDDGVAGTLDFILEMDDGVLEWLVDMKCTAQPEASWALQVGAYCELSRHSGPSAVLHINPKYKEGYIWRVYDTAQVKRQWRAALAWFKVLTELKADA